MFNTIALVAMCLGQTQCGTPIYVNYKMDNMREYTREYINVPYKDGTTKRVPVINGYVPGIRHYQHWGSNCELVAETVVYDYTIWQTYEEVMAKWRKKWAEEKAEKTGRSNVLPRPVSPDPSPIPVLPHPGPEPPRPEPKPRKAPLTNLNLVPVQPDLLPQAPNVDVPDPYRPIDPPTEEPRVVLPPTYRRG